MKRKLLALLLALVMLLALLPETLMPETAVAETSTIDQAIIQGGAILHCFDWSYNEIRANLKAISDAGYVAVQTSPVQQPKDYNAAWTESCDQWWKLYQPLGLTIAPDVEGVPTSWLGTKAELKALCKEAKEYGLYVIVDIVANHLANDTGGGYYLDKDGDNQPDDLNNDGQINELDANLGKDVDPSLNKTEYFHATHHGIDYNYDNDRYNITQKHMGMPDLNTGNAEIQAKVLDLLKDCVDCGVDGFRFDAAKHIELPTDTGTDMNGEAWNGSTFWSTVLDGIRNYAGAGNLFIYGESLSGGAGTSWVDGYTSMMALTDSDYGGRVREALNETNAGKLAVGWYVRCDAARGNVVWVESHDTFEDGGSSGIASDKIVKAWAIVGARADSTALFLARPNERMGLASSDTAWKSPAVAAVNKFKKYFKGKPEYLSYDQDANVTWIERGNQGLVAGVSIVRLEGAGEVELDAHLMSDGRYVDEITGNIFTVSNGKIRGNVGPTGVAVVYKHTEGFITANPIYFVPTGWWLNDGAEFTMNLKNYQNGEETFVNLEDDDSDGIYEGEVPERQWTSVTFARREPGNLPDSAWWNRTDELFPDPGMNCFTITEGTSDGVWSVYGGTVSEDAGYYLVGTMTGWSVIPEYKMTGTGASTEEYMINVPLIRTSKPYHSQFKVVYSPDGVTKQTWFPDGERNNYGDYTGEIPTSGVYTAYFRPNYDGGSDWHNNCIYATQIEYFVNVSDEDKNGVVTVDKATAAPGDVVNVTVAPHDGYELDTLVYQYEKSTNPVTFETVDIENGSFTMPSHNITVIATFKESTAAVPTFEKHSLVLTGQIGVNFFMDLRALTDEERVGTYMTFAISGKGSVSSDPVYFDASLMNSDQLYFKFTCKVNAIQMADTITATYHYGDGKTVSEEYSIAQYIETFEQNKDSFDDTTVALVHALADYGHYVQLFLQNAKNLPLGDGDNAYKPMNRFFTSSYNHDLIADNLDHYGYGITRAFLDRNITAAPYTLILDSETSIKVYFKPADTYTGGATAKWASAAGGYMAEYDLTKDASGRFVVEIANISAHKLGASNTIYVFTGDNCHQQEMPSQYTQIQLTAMSYVLGVLTAAAYANNQAAKNGAASLYAYWQAAVAFKDAHPSK